MKLPLNNPRIVSTFGAIRTINGITRKHQGLDIISNSRDKQIKAVKSGIYRGNFYDKNGFGNYVSVQHDDGIRTIYAHLESINKDLKKGQRIEAGQILGIEGTTGFSTGIHLHIEARKSPYFQNNRINIADYLNIKNERGNVTYTQKGKAMNIVQEKAGLEDKTMDYLNKYDFNTDLFIKLAKAMGGVL